MTDTLALNDNEQHSGIWLRRVRRLWFVWIGFLCLTFPFNVMGTYRMLTTVCELPMEQCSSWAQSDPQLLETLARFHISVETFVIYHIIIFVIVSLFFWASGFLILYYRSNEWHALLVSYLLITLGAGGVSFVFISGSDFNNLPPIVNLVVGMSIFPMYLALSLFFQTFPDGKIYPRWSLFGIVLILLNYTAWVSPAPYNIGYWHPVVMGIWLLIVFGFHIFAIQGVRYRYYYGIKQRQQTKWLIWGAGIALVISILFGWFSNPEIGDLLEGTIVALGFYLPITIAIMIALLRYNLWDIDVIINRTLVYAVLTALLIGIYALIVSSLGLFIEDDGNFVVSLIGAGVIAVIFQPLRIRIQDTINRLLFGQRDEPLEVMVELGKSLEMILTPEAALEYLVETTAGALKLPYVAIQRHDETILVSYGKCLAEPETFPLVYQAENIGALLVSSRSPGETLNTADRLVLDNVARQVSSVVHASTLAYDLQQSRREILTTREEERRRLRRDLHDGLGPALATLTLQAEAAREWLATDMQRSDSLLQEIIDGSQNTLADIRRIVYALRPPALDDLGLVHAIREQASQYSKGNLVIVVEAPEQLPPLPAAIEVATYRIVQEALTNVARHSQAHTCKVCLQINGKMDIEITDDGVGIPEKHRAGVGLNSMHERAAELGGSCLIRSQVGSGTHILVSLPKA